MTSPHRHLLPRFLRLLLTALIALLGLPPAAPQPVDAQAETRPPYVLVDRTDLAARRWVRAEGGQALVDYGDFSLWRLPVAAQPTLSTAPSGLRSAGGQIYLRDYTLDTAQTAAEPEVPKGMRQLDNAGEQLWLVQFIGPLLDEWLDALRADGLEIVAYIPQNTSLVWGSEPAAKIAADPTLEGLVLWQGAYHPAYRLAPALRTLAAGEGEPATSLDVTVQVYQSDRLKTTLAQLQRLAEAQLSQPQPVLNLVNLRLRLSPGVLTQVAALPDVYNVELYSAPQLLDEIQGQVVAGNIDTSAGATLPSGTGYLEWLESKGFSQDPADYPVVDVIDDGIDAGDASTVQHPDFYRLGDPTNDDRILYLTNCTSDADADGGGGHGNLNAGILGGYDAQSGFPYEDAAGYQYGLGISPFGLIAGTKIFSNNGKADLWRCNDSDLVAIHSAYQQGARLTSDSWGAYQEAAYDAGAQLYDLLTRDASTASGNQEMLHVFAAGNSGSAAGAINTPGVAKNVLTVGATENPRDSGVSCNGFTDANNADDIASYSSRGPTSDGRAKPDLVAPGTHVSGPATQDPDYNARFVCTPYYPSGQTLYTWSTGTSHSTPAVAGAAQLAYTYYQQVFTAGQTPSPAMLKALLLNSPRFIAGASAGGDLPGVAQGWGMLDLGRLFDETPRSFYDQDALLVSPGDSVDVQSTVADPGQPVRISLVWTDAPGSTASSRALVNDLDLEVTVGDTTYYGNVFSGEYSTAGGAADSLNNVENVFLPAGLSGDFTVRVVARTLGGDGVPGNSDSTDQDFALLIYNGVSELVPSLSVLQFNWFPVDANLNSSPEPGETFDLEIELGNGPIAAPARQISAHLELTDGLASVLQADSDYPDLEASQRAVNTQRFRLAIDPAQPCGGVLDLSLVVNYDGGQATLPLTPIETALPARAVRVAAFDGPRSIGDFETVDISLPVTETAQLLGLTLSLDISHTAVGDLVLTLRDPTGESITLASRRGYNSDNYADVTFDDQASRNITNSSPPYSGSYRPQEALSIFTGRSQAGVWTFTLADEAAGDVGTLNWVKLTTQYGACTAAQLIFPLVGKDASFLPAIGP